MLLQCAKLLELNLDERKEVLKQSGLCLYCLKHAAELECYGRGGFSKPKCTRSGCNGEHAVGAHKLLGEGDASVNLITEGDYESEEEEEWWVSTVRVEEEEEEEDEEEDMEEVEDSEPEGNGEREIRYFTSTHVRKDDSGREDELEYFWEAPSPSEPYKREEDRWWSPGPPESSSEEDEEEVRYLTDVLGLGPKGNEVKDGEPPSLTGSVSSTSGSSRDLHQGDLLNRVGNRQEPPKVQNRLMRRRLRGGDLGKW